MSTFLVDTVNMTPTSDLDPRAPDRRRPGPTSTAEGLDGIGLREIARRAELSHGAPGRHFPTLGALLAAVAAEGFRDLYAAVDAAVEDAESADPLDRLSPPRPAGT